MPGVRVPAHHTHSHVTEAVRNTGLQISAGVREVIQGQRREGSGQARRSRDGGQHWTGCPGVAQVGKDDKRPSAEHLACLDLVTNKFSRRDLTRALLVAPAVQVATILDTRWRCYKRFSFGNCVSQVGRGGAMEGGCWQRRGQPGHCLSLLTHTGNLEPPILEVCLTPAYLGHTGSPTTDSSPESSVLPAGAQDTCSQETCKSSFL